MQDFLLKFSAVKKCISLGLICTVLAILVSCSKKAETIPAATFSWFEYTGNDRMFENTLAEDHYRNPLIAGFYPDPSIAKVNDDYFLTMSSFAYTPGLPVFHSKDLVNWTQIGNAITRRSQLKLESGQGISRGIFAPTLRFHEGLFYIITTDVDGIGNFYITAENPAGPWSDPVVLPEIQGIDPDIFFDDDGKVYITHNGEPVGEALYDGHRAIWMWEYDLENKKVVANSGKVIVNGGVDISTQPIWIEAPHIYKINDWYYLSCAEGGTSTGHSQVVLRTRSLQEPFEAFEGNPILTQRDLPENRNNKITSTGHADLVQTQNGEWWAVFLGVRPYDQEFFNTGRETFMLPVRWENEWPIILDANTPMPLQVLRPNLPLTKTSAPPQSGNFTWRDEFNSSVLSLEWLKLRTSSSNWHTFSADNNAIQLQALNISLQEKRQPAYLGHRQQHASFTASTELELPTSTGISAGIAVFQSSDFHYFFAARKTAGSYVVVVEQVKNGEAKELKVQAIESKDHLTLKIVQDEGKISFYFVDNGGKDIPVLEAEDAKLLSTNVAGGFVGASIGIHARQDN